MPMPKPGEAPMYTGTLDCVKKTISLEGPKGLYKGEFLYSTEGYCLFFIVSLFYANFWSSFWLENYVGCTMYVSTEFDES